MFEFSATRTEAPTGPDLDSGGPGAYIILKIFVNYIDVTKNKIDTYCMYI